MKKFKFKIEYVYIIVFVLLIVGLASFVINFGLDIVKPSENATPSTTIEVDWEAQYPFKGEKTVAKEENDVNTSKIDRIKVVASSICNFVGNRTDLLLQSDNIKKLGANTKKFFNHDAKFTQGDLQEIYNGQIIEIEKVDESYGKDAVAYTSDFNEYLKSKDIPLVYVQPLTKFDDSNEYPSAINENRDLLLNGLNAEGVDVLDLRENAKTDNVDLSNVFYKTDHHWKTTAGLWATSCILDNLNNNYDLNFDSSVLDTNKFEIISYQNAMFGSYGNTAGRCWADPENHDVYYPTFDTKFRIEIPNRELDETGSFDVLFNNEKVEEFTTGEPGYVYETSCYGNTPLTRITNLNNKNAPKVLVIRDSYALAILPYLSCVSSQVDSIDLRKGNGNFTGSVRTYIEKINPDVVLIIYSSAKTTPFD